MQCKALFLACLACFLTACSAKIEYVPLKCNVTPPLKPLCSDYIEFFDCLKAKAKYLSDLELTLQKCL